MLREFIYDIFLRNSASQIARNMNAIFYSNIITHQTLSNISFWKLWSHKRTIIPIRNKGGKWLMLPSSQIHLTVPVNYHCYMVFTSKMIVTHLAQIWMLNNLDRWVSYKLNQIRESNVWKPSFCYYVVKYEIWREDKKLLWFIN